MARELNVPVIALSQLSRGVEPHQTSGPNAQAICVNQASIEQDADLVLNDLTATRLQPGTQRPIAASPESDPSPSTVATGL